jgi:fructose-1,6-bisphosphatase/inositol monophosphatase family enzyme
MIIDLLRAEFPTYLPVLDEMFTARRGHGAWLNGMHSPLPWDIEMGHLLVLEAGGKVTKQRDEDEGDLFICSIGILFIL